MAPKVILNGTSAARRQSESSKKVWQSGRTTAAAFVGMNFSARIPHFLLLSVSLPITSDATDEASRPRSPHLRNAAGEPGPARG